MKSVSVRADDKRVELLEREPPVLGTPTQARLRMLEVGICGTDREIASGQYGTAPDGHEHLVLGHESLGRVVEVGAEVEGLRVGDLVVPMVRRPCLRGECLPCREGRQDFCSTGAFSERGIHKADGFMSEQVVEEERWLVKVPHALREVAVLVEPLTIAVKALSQLDVIQQRLPWACPLGAGGAPRECHDALVLGAGPVGLLGAMALRVAGYRVTIYSRSPAPNAAADIADAIGARYVSSSEIAPDELPAITGGIDVVYEAVGASQVAFDVLRVLGTNGVFIFTGVPGRRGPVPIDSDLLMRNIVLKNQVVLGSVNAGRAHFEQAIESLGEFHRRWPAAVAALITARHPLTAAGELLTGKGRGIKNVLVLSGA